MEVILLERIARLGQMGDVVKVRSGYARNFLLPQGKALRANEQSRHRFENERVRLEARNLERRHEAEAVGAKIDGQAFTAIRQAGETGQLYGSVTTRDLVEVMEAEGLSVARSQVGLEQPIKTIGIHTVLINLQAEVTASVTVNIARSDEEAKRQARGEDPIAPDEDDEEAGATGEESDDQADGDSEEAAAPADDEADSESGEAETT